VRKKNFNFLSYIPTATLVVGLIVSWARFQAMAENTKAKVDELKTEVKEVIDENKELEKRVEVNKTQQDNIQREVEQINDKTDKIYDTLVELSKKKR
jgi:predicted nuclease with TOPRIM domain